MFTRLMGSESVWKADATFLKFEGKELDIW